jgi:hypothetical protein
LFSVAMVGTSTDPFMRSAYRLGREWYGVPGR